MKKMIIIERSRFARLLRNYRKSLYMNTLLTHICKQRRTLLTLTAEEICELLQLDPEEVRRRPFAAACVTMKSTGFVTMT